MAFESYKIGEFEVLGRVINTLIKGFADSQRAQSRLIQTAKLASLGELCSGVAHELNNPIFMIQGFTERISDKIDELRKVSREDVQDYLTYIDEGCSRMSAIVGHISDFSRRSEDEFQETDLNNVIAESFILQREQLKLKNISYSLNLLHQDAVIHGDRFRLEQVFMNLIINARDAIEEKHGTGGGKITVTSFRENNDFVIRFADNGTGVPALARDSLFDPFFTTKEVGKGTGLGLSIAYGIIQDHQGQITWENPKEGGAAFVVRIPALAQG